MKVSIFGLGYVGSVSAACLAHLGHDVIGVDINPQKVEAINAGQTPIVEARVAELVAEGSRAGKLRATADVATAIRESEVSLLCVATPSLPNGKLDVRSLERVCHQIGEALRGKKSFHVIANRSTVLPGTIQNVVIANLEAASNSQAGKRFAACMNPEFMREGSAVADFMNPPFTVIGGAEATHRAPLKELYSFAPTPIFETSIEVAEMLKYACNAYHALKVSFANEIGTFCTQAGIDPHAVMEIFAKDTKLNISATYLKPGFAFGGSCLPKDLRALTYRAKELDLRLPLLESVMPSNSEHIERAVQQILQLGKRNVAVLGLSFKAGTDDLRESPSVQVIKRLLGEGCQVQVWDDQVSLGRLIGSNRQFIEDVIPHIGALISDDLPAVIAKADIVLILTRALTHAAIAPHLRPHQQVIDLERLESHLAAAVSLR